MKKRFLAIILCAMLMVMSLPQAAVTAFAEGIGNTYESIKSAIAPRGSIVDSGSCGNPNANSGNNVLWKLESDGTLTIYPNPSPNGTDFSMSNSSGASTTERPWYQYRSSINSLVVENGVTTIGNVTCDTFPNLTSVSIPNSVTTIGFRAFYNCKALTSLYIPESVKKLRVLVFADVTP